MALWPFGKKKTSDSDDYGSYSRREREDPFVSRPAEAPATPTRPRASSGDFHDVQYMNPVKDKGSTIVQTTPDPEQVKEAEEAAVVQREHDAVNGETGPFDGDNVDINDFDFSDFSAGLLNLGSIQLALPKNSQVQVEMGEQGPRMLHVITEFGRVTPVAFAAPNSGGMWEESSDEIAEGMRAEGMPVEYEEGPWGREVVGTGDNGIIRIIGVQGPRWLYRVTLAAPHGKEDRLADLGREIIARSFIYRGNTPVLAGNSLPVELPAQLALQIQQAMQQQQLQQQNQQNQQGQGEQPGQPDQTEQP